MKPQEDWAHWTPPEWLHAPIAPPDPTYRAIALARQATLTKPPGALGRLEEVAVQLAALQASATPTVDPAHLTIFAADHGVAAHGVSAFPQSVTAAMIKNFALRPCSGYGGAAASVAARALGVTLEVINLGTVDAEHARNPERGCNPEHGRGGGLSPPDNAEHARNPERGCNPERGRGGGLSPPDNREHPRGMETRILGPGSADFSLTAALLPTQLTRALDVGREAVMRLHAPRLFIGGEMGIGNTTSAAALVCALTGAPPEQVAGPGTGLDAAGMARKIAVLHAALALHQEHLSQPLTALGHVGGFEIAALAGAYLTCAQRGVPALVDGFICSAAALIAVRWRAEVRPWLLFAHTSAEPGHSHVLTALEAAPLLNLGMRLGEGSGALAALPLLRLACALHNGMATFSEAQVAEKLS